MNKVKYLDILEILMNVAKECFKWRYRNGFLEIFIEILQISMKVPDLQVIRYSYLLLGLVSHLNQDVPNAVYAWQRLIDFSEEENHLLTAVKALEILGGVYEDK